MLNVEKLIYMYVVTNQNKNERAFQFTDCNTFSTTIITIFHFSF